LHKRKTALLAQGRKEGKLGVKTPDKRNAYTRRTYYEPTAAEKASFEAVQKAICSSIMLYHQNSNKLLFLQINGSHERNFGVMVFYLKDGYCWIT
jgi:hypothetical protein